ncbi:NAD(P)-binding protein [Hesseltinella vesiculosa]|uniref:NAD(P)-binding protein n=1 Tax=Hesseltinella vesiculosa TaxID=101127 RepID=A0A1X2GFF3_9FUNG|nr:NAD(P)-binding protein [Hesseltinella vesiculosa]
MAGNVLVTGATRGIGLAIAHAFAKQNYTLTLIGRDVDRVANVQQLFQNQYGDHHKALAMDVGNKSNVDTILKSVLKEKQFSVLVNAAGIAKDSLLIKLQDDDLQEIIRTNLMGTMYVSQHVAKSMIRKRQGGCIINVSSVVGLQGNIGQCAYSASKAGIIGFTKSLAKELGPLQIRVNALAPGFIETDMTADLLADEQKKQKLLESIPMRRLGHVDDVAQAAVFLAQSTYIHGHVLNVDGGITL